MLHQGNLITVSKVILTSQAYAARTHTLKMDHSAFTSL